MAFDVAQARRDARTRTRAVRALLALALGAIAAALAWIGQAALAAVGAASGGTYAALAAGLAALGVAALRAGHAENAHLRAPDVVAGWLRAREVGPHTDDPAERVLRNVLEEVAVAAGLPVPRLFVLDDAPGVNALAVGADAARGAVFVSAPAAQHLGRDALQAVVAHEVAHLAAGDAEVHAATAGAAAALRAAVRPTLWMLVGAGRLVRSVAEPDHPTGASAAVGLGLLVPLLAVAVPGLALMASGSGLLAALGLVGLGLPAVGALGLLLARTLDRAVSRQAEFAADALAVELTRHPEALADALRAVRDGSLRGLVLSPHVDRLRPFFFARPDTQPDAFDGLWEAHPRADARLARLGAERGRWTPRAPAAPRPVRSPRASPVESAAAWLALLPADLAGAAHAPALAGPLALALLLDAEPAARARQTAHLNGTAAAAEALAARLATLPAGARLPLLEVALPALRALPASDRDALLAAAERLAMSDGRLSVAEIALVQGLRVALRPPAERASAPVAAGSVVAHAGVVLTAVARAGTPHDEAAQRAFAAGADRLAALVPGRARPADLSPAALAASLDALARADAHARQSVVDAAFAAAAADARTTLGEADLVRMLALALGVPCPVAPPPLVAG